MLIVLTLRALQFNLDADALGFEANTECELEITIDADCLVAECDFILSFGDGEHYLSVLASMDGGAVTIAGGTVATIFSYPQCGGDDEFAPLAEGDASSLITQWRADHPNAADTVFHLRDAMAYPEGNDGGDFSVFSDEITHNEWPLTLVIANADDAGESNLFWSNGDREAHCTFSSTFNTDSDLTLSIQNDWSHSGEGLDVFSIEIDRFCADVPTETPTETPVVPYTNELCDTASYSVIKGTWTADEDECALKNSNSGAGNIVWFGSADGLSPDTRFVDNAFVLTAEIEIHSGNDAGIMFRTGESSITNDEGPTYCPFTHK